MTALIVSFVSVGDTALEVVEHEGRGWVSVRRACEALGVDPDSQRVRLKASPWATTAMITVIDPAGMPRPAFFVDAEAFPMWMATINVSRVDEAAAKRLLVFQCEAKRVLAEHFGVGRRASTPSLEPARGLDVARAAVDPRALLQMVTGLAAAAEATLQQIDTVRAEVAVVRAEVREEVAAANARADAAVLVVDSLKKQGVRFREDARAIKAAVAHISRRIKAEAPFTISGDWPTIFRAARKELGLHRDSATSTSPTPSGAPVKQRRAKPIGECIKRADQVLTYARVATAHGVSGCDVRTINRILNGDDAANVVDMPTEHLQ